MASNINTVNISLSYSRYNVPETNIIMCTVCQKRSCIHSIHFVYILSVFHGHCLNSTNLIVSVLDILNINSINSKSQTNFCVVVLSQRRTTATARLSTNPQRMEKKQPFTPKHRYLWVSITQSPVINVVCWWGEEVMWTSVKDRLTDD